MRFTPDNSVDFEKRLQQADLSLFDPITTSATADDRRSLLALQAAVRLPGYAYLEIGSERGGSLQTHLADPWCAAIFSIDLRVSSVPDARGTGFVYHDNTTAHMIAGLTKYYGKTVDKILTFDHRAAEVSTVKITPAPHLIFIDGEHTRKAVTTDFADARRFASSETLIAFHDAQLVHIGIKDCLNTLEREGIPSHSAGLPGAVYVIAIGPNARERIEKIQIQHTPPDTFFRRAPAYLRNHKRQLRRQKRLLRSQKLRLLLRRLRQKLLN